MIFAAAGLAFSAISAYGQYRAGQAANAAAIGQAQGLERQAEFARFRGRQAALSHKQEANDQLQAILENLARSSAVAAAGNVDAFTGSADGVKRRVMKYGGRNVIKATENARLTELMGGFQANQYLFQATQVRLAGKEAKRQAKFSAIMTIAKGVAGFGQAGGFGFGGSTGVADLGGFSAPSVTGGTTGFAY